MYRLVFSMQARTDWDYWKQSGNTAITRKITTLLEDMTEHPYMGIGKPEPLKYELSGCWSRRINREHRIIYRVKETEIMELIYLFAILAVPGITGIIYAAVEFHRQNRRPAKKDIKHINECKLCSCRRRCF